MVATAGQLAPEFYGLGATCDPYERRFTLKTFAKKFAQQAFLAGDRLGVHVTPSHYYSPVASRKQLRLEESEWRRKLDPIPFEWDIAAQAEWLLHNAAGHPAELTLPEIYHASGSVGGFRYGPLEAQFLYAYLRTNAPARVVEVGSGSSTLVMSRAVDRNLAEGRRATSIVAFDPYTARKVENLRHVEARPIGGLSISMSDLDLGRGDVLFIDSTHTVRTGSELSHLYLEVLPHLPAGVVVHIHDIYLPYLYAPNVYDSMFDWQETTLLTALLAGSQHLSILASMSGLFHENSQVLGEAFPEFEPAEMDRGILRDDDAGHFPSATWLRVNDSGTH